MRRTKSTRSKDTDILLGSPRPFFNPFTPGLGKLFLFRLMDSDFQHKSLKEIGAELVHDAGEPANAKTDATPGRTRKKKTPVGAARPQKAKSQRPRSG